MNTAYESSTNRRTYIRLAYTPGRRPNMIVADKRFDIIDISESGLRFHNPGHLPLASSFKARVTLLAGTALDVTVGIEWQENGEVGASLEQLIPAAVIREEQRRIILGQ